MCAPEPTPPQATAAAQTSTNVATSIANSRVLNPNEIGPNGTKTVTYGNPYTWKDPFTGQSYTVDQPTITTTLSEGQQAIKDEQDRASLNLATLGADLSGTLGDKLTDNFTIGNPSVEARLFELGSARLNPLFAQRRGDLETKLSNQGIKRGSEAWDRAMTSFGQQENDAYNQLLLSGRGQAVQEQFGEDNQRINQISALLNGGQVSQPNFLTGFQGAAMPTTDVAGIIANSDAQRAAAASANGGLWGSALSGLGGLFALSDERAKTDIKKVGKTDDGQNVYAYRYKSGGPMQLGLMAQEVRKKTPEAVATRPDGLMAVNYERALSL